MSSNFASLRSNRKNLLTKLTEEIKKQAKGSSDERFWKLPVDAKTGIGFATIRFLPAPQGEDIPWVRVFNHGFQINGSWFIENCPTTLPDRPCPVCKENSKLWQSGGEGSPQRKTASDRKRKLQFISNILVIDDPKNPANNGKVMLFKYGKKIHDKIMELLEPAFPDQQPANPFDLWEGCNFKLKAQKKDGFQNYDKSEFAPPSDVADGDEAAAEKLWESEHKLQPFVAEAQFKNYDVLEKAFIKAVSGSNAPKTAEESIDDEAAEAISGASEDAPKPRATAKPTAKPAAKPKVAAPKVEEEPSAEEADLKNFFAGVVDDDE